MSPKDLARVICGMNGEPVWPLTGNGVILAAGPITYQPGTNPYRIVLRAIPKVLLGVDVMEFVVHSQIWQSRYKQGDGTLNPKVNGFEVMSFDRGDYFYPFAPEKNPVKEYLAAYEQWLNRIQLDFQLEHPHSIGPGLPSPKSVAWT